MQYPTIDVEELPLNQLPKTKIFSQGQISKKNHKFQIPLFRLQQKQDNSLTEPIKQIKSVRFKDDVEIINEQILEEQILTEDQSIQQQQQKHQNTSILPIMPINKLSFPIRLDKIRQKIDKDIQFFQKNSTKNTSNRFEIPKRFGSVNRSDNSKKSNRFNNNIAFDPWNINYAFAPLSARLQYEQQKACSLNSSYSLIQDYNEQYSYRNYYNPNNSSQSNNNFLNNSILSNKSNIYRKKPLNQKYQCTSPLSQSINSSRNSQYTLPYQFQETSSNYKNFVPTLSNTPTSIYNTIKMDRYANEQENLENQPITFKSGVFLKSISPSNYNNTIGNIKTIQQSVNSSYTLKETKDDEQEHFGEMLSQIKNHITQKKQQQQCKRKQNKSPQKLKRLSLELQNMIDQSKNITQPSKMLNQNIQNQVIEQIKSKFISDQIKNVLLKKINKDQHIDIK